MNIDADVFKNFELRGNQRLQLRAEVFNLFNHINTNKLGLALNTQSTFGEGTSFYENRAIQVGGKWTF